MAERKAATIMQTPKYQAMNATSRRLNNLELLAARCHLKVDLARDPERADHLHILDAKGERLSLYEIGAEGVTTHDRLALVDGRSTTIGVADLAATLVLEKDGVEVRRVPLALLPGRLNVVSP